MKNLTKRGLCKVVLIAGTVALTLLPGCEIDHGLGLLESKISGEIHFVNTDRRPDYVNGVRVVAAVNFPPQSLSDVVFGNAVDYGVDTVKYELPAPIATYLAVAVVWRKQGSDWNFSNLMGIYGVNTQKLEFELKPVHLTKEQPVADSIDIVADWTLASFDATVKGKLTFVGEWPKDTEFVGITALTGVPDLSNLRNALPYLRGLDVTVPSFVEKYNYSMNVPYGTYQLIGLFWKGESTPIDQIKLLGYYRAAPGSDAPGEVSIEPNGTITGIDFTVDFNLLPDGLNPGAGQ